MDKHIICEEKIKCEDKLLARIVPNANLCATLFVTIRGVTEKGKINIYINITDWPRVRRIFHAITIYNSLENVRWGGVRDARVSTIHSRCVFFYRLPPPSPSFTLHSHEPTNRDPATLFATDTTLVSVYYCTRCAPALSELCHTYIIFFFSPLHGWILICIVQIFAFKSVTICLNAFCATVIWSQMRRTAHRRAWRALHLLGALAAHISRER